MSQKHGHGFVMYGSAAFYFVLGAVLKKMIDLIWIVLRAARHNSDEHPLKYARDKILTAPIYFCLFANIMHCSIVYGCRKVRHCGDRDSVGTPQKNKGVIKHPP